MVPWLKPTDVTLLQPYFMHEPNCMGPVLSVREELAEQVAHVTEIAKSIEAWFAGVTEIDGLQALLEGDDAPARWGKGLYSMRTRRCSRSTR